jgi:hypothetical protein
VNTPILLVGLVVFGVGFIAVFARSGIRGRVPGLATIAAGALLVLVARAPTSAATWFVVATSAATFIGLLAFAAVLARRAASAGASLLHLDDDT